MAQLADESRGELRQQHALVQLDGLDLRWSLRDPSEKFTPYLLTGFGVGRSHDPELNLYSRGGTPALAWA